MFPHLSLKITGRPERFSFCEGSWSLKQVACWLPCRPILLLPPTTDHLFTCTQMCTSAHKCAQLHTNLCKLCRTKVNRSTTNLLWLLHFLNGGNKLCMHVKPFTSVEHKVWTNFGQTCQILHWHIGHWKSLYGRFGRSSQQVCSQIREKRSLFENFNYFHKHIPY